MKQREIERATVQVMDSCRKGKTEWTDMTGF